MYQSGKLSPDEFTLLTTRYASAMLDGAKEGQLASDYAGFLGDIYSQTGIDWSPMGVVGNPYIAAIKASEQIVEWKSQGLSDEKIRELSLKNDIIASTLSPVDVSGVVNLLDNGASSKDVIRFASGVALGKVLQKTQVGSQNIDPSKSIAGQQAKLTPEMESKILGGQRIGTSNKIIGGHSSNVNDGNPKYAVETLKINPDGTRSVKYITQFDDGNLSKIKTSTLFPDSWSDKNIVDSVNKVGNTSPIGQRSSTGETLHRGTVKGVEIDVIKKGTEITAGYPVGGKPTPGFNPIK